MTVVYKVTDVNMHRFSDYIFFDPQKAKDFAFEMNRKFSHDYPYSRFLVSTAELMDEEEK